MDIYSKGGLSKQGQKGFWATSASCKAIGDTIRVESQPKNAPGFLVLEELTWTYRLIIAHEKDCIIFDILQLLKWLKGIQQERIVIIHQILEKKYSFIIPNTGNFNHFYIARFEASSKYII